MAGREFASVSAKEAISTAHDAAVRSFSEWTRTSFASAARFRQLANVALVADHGELHPARQSS